MSGRVYGGVTDAGTGNVITNAAVSAPPYAVTINSGIYYFLTPGSATVDVTASAPDYVPQTKKVTVIDGQMKHVPFALVHV